jgi:hypothetical protein
MQHTTIAVDLAKSVFQVAISHRPWGVAVWSLVLSVGADQVKLNHSNGCRSETDTYQATLRGLKARTLSTSSTRSTSVR